ncbi:MAG: hypothetical protein NC110_04455 [Ruminococcus sp.]|nr:hypothetical protein [Ruminococcus sp.]
MKKNIEKKIIALFLTAATIASLSACTASTKEEFTLQPFTSNVSVKHNDTQYEGTVDYQSPTQISFTITKPENIAGIKIEECSSEIKVSFDDLKFISPPFDADLKSDNIFKNLFEALKAIAGCTVEIDTQSKNSLNTDYIFGCCTAVIDGTAKMLTTIEADSKVYVFAA